MLGSALFAVTGAHIATEFFGFELEQIGLFMGIPLTVGCIIGEATAGWVSDAMINAYAKRHNGYRKPEARLYLIPFTLLLGIGCALYGYCVQSGRPWIDAAVVMAISGVGVQVGTTMVYTYCTDSYKPQSGEIGAIINLFKSGMLALKFREGSFADFSVVFAFNIGFYALPFGIGAGFDASFGTLAAINLVLLISLLVLLWKGEKIREWQGTPTDHTDI